MPGAPTDIRAVRVLELNANHHAYQTMKGGLPPATRTRPHASPRSCTQALLIAGELPEDPAMYSELVCTLDLTNDLIYP